MNKNQQAQAPKSQFSGYKLSGSKVASSTDPRWWNNDPIAQKSKPAIDIDDMRVLSMVGALGGGMDRVTIAREVINEDFQTKYMVLREATQGQFDATGTLAKVDVFFTNGMCVRGITISQHTKNHKLVAGMPYRLYKDNNQATQRAYDVSFPRETQDSFYAVILKGFEDCFEQDESIKPWERKAKAETAGADAQAGTDKTASGETVISGNAAMGA